MKNHYKDHEKHNISDQLKFGQVCVLDLPSSGIKHIVTMSKLRNKILHVESAEESLALVLKYKSSVSPVGQNCILK